MSRLGLGNCTVPGSDIHYPTFKTHIMPSDTVLATLQTSHWASPQPVRRVSSFLSNAWTNWVLNMLNHLFEGFPHSSVGKESTCNAGDPGSIPGSAGEGRGYPLQYFWASLVAQQVKNLPAMQRPGLGRSPGEEKGYPLQHSGLENSMDCIVHGITKSWTRQSFEYVK